MRSLAILALALCASLAAVGQSDASSVTSPWTLRAALTEARDHSPEAAIAAARLDRAQAMVDQSGAASLPQVTLSAGYTQTNNPMMAFGSILNQGAFTPAIDFNAPGQVDNLNLTGMVAYSLYSGGRTASTQAAARAGATASAHDRDATFARLDAAVATAYFNIRQAREAIAALDAAIATYEESLRIARLRFEAGELLKSELLNLEVRLAQTREQHLAARQQATLAERHFLYLLGHPPLAGQPVALATDDPAVTALSAPAATSTASIEQRPELHALASRREAAAASLDAAASGRRPSVNAFASYQFDKGWRLDGDGDSWMAGLQAQWSVFDGKATTGKIRAARADLTETEAAQRQLELGLQLELEQARLAHRFATEQLDVTATLVTQAEEAARISRERFEAGALLSTELIGAETRLTEARVRRAVATAAERIAAVQLRRAAGLPILP
ncbi:TolC family protein [Actomonas aquatica]|uniref:TolC family protein n=1 Tax=Actomonas aquatica TaxID=2866162 RepID=A0ABZ1C4R0_9BACT|nr:TolC family protein [Opitutus sp. WL0086]WRQ86345.1 TolC family protein [Opitutus sp. WL0086]